MQPSTRSTHHALRHARCLLATTLVAVTLAAGSAIAAVPTSTTIEGALTATGGTPAADGSYKLTFSIYAAQTGGAAIWTEGAVNVAVAGGRFTHALGVTKPLNAKLLASAASAWLGLKVGADPELPRQRLRATPYAVVAARAASVACTGCLGGAQLGNGSVAASKVSFKYAGGASKGGAALDLACTACVSVAELKFDGDVDLKGASLKAKNGVFTGDVIASTVTATAFVGDGSKLTGIKTPGGSCTKAGQVVKGIAADGTLICVAAMDPAGLPADGLDEISNGLLANQFVDTIGTKDKGVPIPDNTGSSANSTLIFPNIGVAQAISATIEITNTDLSTIAVTILPPNDKKVGYVICDPCGGKDKKSYKATFPPTKSKTGDITAWVGKNPQGTWNLKVADTSFCIVQAPGNGALCDVKLKTDGQIVDWSIKIQTLSNQKVQAKGRLLVDKSVRLGNDTAPCTATTAGSIRWNGTSFQGCNGKKYFDIKLYVGPGSKTAPAGTSCLGIKQTAADALDGVYWIDPDGGSSANAFQALCDMTSHGGGWTLAFNLDTNDGSVRHYFDTTFWTKKTTVGTAATALVGDFKSEAFSALPAKQIMIKAHIEGAQKGTAYYAFTAAYTGKSLQTLLSTVANKTVTGARLGATGSVGAGGRARNAGDAFIDNSQALIFNSTYQPKDAQNYTRIGTNYASVCGIISCDGHNYGGLGGRHFRGGWGAYYEAAQLNGYCYSQGVYGTNHSAYLGNNAASGCGYAARDMDVAVWVR